MTVADLIAHLERRGACDDALAWLRTLTPDADAETAWATCKRGDWLVWLVTHSGIAPAVGDRALRLIACDCAEDALPHWETWAAKHAPQHLAAPRRVVVVARAYAMGEASAEQLAAAWDAAWDAARAASARAAGAADRAARASQARIARRHVAWATVRDALEVTP